jgi:hypothetical protein
MLISPAYLEQNKQLHSEPGYGTKGYHYAKEIIPLANALRSADILDYGCGQRTLEKALGLPIRNYDPCIPGLDSPPEPADIVVCTDVLEHIEPDCLDAVLDDLKRVTRHLGFFVVDTRPAVKILPDGRNAHLIQEPAEWWFPKFFSRWEIVQVATRFIRADKRCGFTVIVRNA